MKFKVGDRVRYRMKVGNWDGIENGEVGVILGDPGPGPDGDSRSSVDFGRKVSTLMDSVLELIPPDREQTIPWSQCEWKPRDLHVTI